MLRAYGTSDRGLRPTNQDCFAAEDGLGLCVVADGLGGHQGGDVAARLAVDAILEFVRDRVRRSEPPTDPWPMGFDATISESANLLRTAIQLAGLRILEAAVGDLGLAGMATTVVSALASGGRVSIGHVGDSRLYLARQGQIQLLTEDDSWMATMLSREPSADRSRFSHHPMRGALTNVVGARIGTEVHVHEETLDDGDLLILTTDGVHDAVDEHDLAGLALGAAPEELAPRLVETALRRGSHDNCTAVVAQYVDSAARRL